MLFKHKILLAFLSLFLFQLSSNAESLNSSHSKNNIETLAEGFVNPGSVEKPSWFKQSFLDFRDDVEEAKENNKQIILYFYQDGCPYCKKLLQDNFGNHDISQYTKKHYEVIAINMWGDREVTALDGKVYTEKTFTEKYKVMFTPTILMLDANAHVALRINGYYHPNKFKSALQYIAEVRKSSSPSQLSFSEYYAKQPQVKASGKLHLSSGFFKAPYNLLPAFRSASKPLLVMFEQKNCSYCDELHLDILERKEIKEKLTKFDIVLLDMWSDTKVITPDGTKTSAKQWAKKLNIQSGPSLVFFDDKTNQEVFRTDGYLKSFHIQGIMEYVLSDSYLTQPNFQRWLGAKTEALEAKGIHVDLWK